MRRENKITRELWLLETAVAWGYLTKVAEGLAEAFLLVSWGESNIRSGSPTTGMLFCPQILGLKIADSASLPRTRRLGIFGVVRLHRERTLQSRWGRSSTG